MWSDVLGQERAQAVLLNLVTQQRLPYGVLIYGPPKTGKFKLAKAFARIINCRGTLAFDCKCISCVKANAGYHPDLQMLVPNDRQSISIDQVRQGVIQAFEYTVSEGKRKLAIIRSADKLQQAASHALLKTLEEPRGDATIILTSSQPSLLLETIRSRCVQVRLSFNTDKNLSQLLERDNQEPDPILIELMGGSYSLERIKDDLPNLKYLFDGSDIEVAEKIEVDALKNELIYLGCTFAHMQRSALQQFGHVLVQRANSTKLGKLFNYTDQALKFLNKGVRPFLTIRWYEAKVREVLN